MRHSVSKIIAERERVLHEMRARHIPVAASLANFVFFDTGLASTDVAKALVRDGIIVKPWLEPGYAEFIRASIGTPEENDRLIASVERLVAVSRYEPQLVGSR